MIGGIFIGSGEARQYGENLSLIFSLARQAGQALDRAQLFERERASVGRLRKLQAVTAALSQAVTARGREPHLPRARGDRRRRASRASSCSAATARMPRRPSVGVVASIGLDGPDGEIPAAAEAPIRRSLRGGRPASVGRRLDRVPARERGARARSCRPSRRIADADREWLLTLVSQGEQALDRAGRYETERGIAETMQRSVLPERLPSVSGVTLAARYLPGTVGVDVGGDWYDIIQLEDGSIGLVVGDVVGKGVQAAAMMGQLRNALRAFAFEYDDPHTVVSRLDKLVEGMMDSAFATLVYLVVDPRQRRAQYVVAGHPPPLIRSPDGTTSFLEQGRSLPIGVDASLDVRGGRGPARAGLDDPALHRRPRRAPRHAARRGAAPARRSGVGERGRSRGARRDGARGADRRQRAARRHRGARDPVRGARASTTSGSCSRRPSTAWSRCARCCGRGSQRGSVDAGVAAEAVLAVWEACANAVEHAQQPSQSSFRLRATLDDAGRMRIEVRDSGQWKAGRGHGRARPRAGPDAVVHGHGRGEPERATARLS